MRKTILFILGFTILFSQSFICAQASNSMTSYRVKAAIRKYKYGNYSGCLQDCQDIVKYNPNGIAYYYMAMVYSKAGRKAEAVKYYGLVISMAKTPKLRDFAIRGKRCIETPDQCNPPPVAPQQIEEDELDRFINGSSINVSDSVRSDYQQKHLNNLRNEINNGKELDDYDFKDIKDYSNHRTYNNMENKLAQAYTDDDIQNALKVLNESGYSRAAQDQNLTPEVAQIKSLINASSLSNLNSNKSTSIEDILPSMTSAQKDGAKTYSPQMIQSIILNSTMMDEFNYKLYDNQ